MIVDLGAALDIPTLFVPHSEARCWPTAVHPDRHCYREHELENRVEEFLVTRYPQTKVTRQERWPGIGVIDLVCRTEVPFGLAVAIIELKVTPARRRAHDQLAYYMRHAISFYEADPDSVSITGVLGAFLIGPAPDPRPWWLSHWQMRIEDAA